MKDKKFPLWLGLLASLSLGGCELTTQDPAAMAPTQPSVIPLTPDTPFTVMGRAEFLATGGLHFGYPGVSLGFSIQARSAALVASSTSDQSYLEILVDDQAPQLVRLSRSPRPITLFTAENSGLHQIQVIHRTETWQGVVTAHHLAIEEGQLLPPPAPPKRRLLVLGDSVTCGEAVERTSDCKKTSRWWNPRLSYGMLLAQTLEAQVHLVCYGGRGLVRSWNGKTDELNLPDFFELTIADPKDPIPWNHQSYQPDFILSAIGTNDFSTGIPPQGHYVDTYVTFIKRLQEIYPQAQIALTEGAILQGKEKAALQDYLNITAAQFTDRVHLLPSQHYPGDHCDAHPTGEQHAAMAGDLAPLVRLIMAW